MYEKILLPTDGSKASENAAKHAIIMADKYDSMIYVLTVLETRPTSGITIDILKREGEIALDDISKIFKDIEEDFENEIEKHFLMKEGTAADEILKTAEENDIDIIVMGASGKHRLERFILGSVAEQVVRDSKCPVLTIH
ncbi:MAG: universal stress protein [Methanobacteriaceae archaeon]|nr:universal stress protein [Methanobacteriaceae archaeon]